MIFALLEFKNSLYCYLKNLLATKVCQLPNPKQKDKVAAAAKMPYSVNTLLSIYSVKYFDFKSESHLKNHGVVQ